MRSEKEKMLAGELYDPLDPELVVGRTKARELCYELNHSRENETEKRRQILCELFRSGGEDVWLEPPFYCDYGSHISLGKRVFFNFNCVVLDVCEVTIGDSVFMGPNVQIYTATHPMEARLRRDQESGKPVVIGNDVWIGGGAILCPGVTIGDRTVIGAGSVVTRSMPSDSFCAGNPCRVIRPIDNSDFDNTEMDQTHR